MKVKISADSTADLSPELLASIDALRWELRDPGQ